MFIFLLLIIKQFVSGGFSECANTAGAGENPAFRFRVSSPLKICPFLFPVCGVVMAPEKFSGAAHFVGFLADSALFHK